MATANATADPLRCAKDNNQRGDDIPKGDNQKGDDIATVRNGG